jgi:multidrug efflux system membrane fusion protein
VRTGPYGQLQVPVLEGLRPGEWVVAAGGHLLREGQAVRPVDRDDRAVPLAAPAAATADAP